MTLKQCLMLAAMASLTACAGLQPAGRNAGRAPEAIPAQSQPTRTAPQQAAPLPPPPAETQRQTAPTQAPTQAQTQAPPAQPPVASEARITPAPATRARADDDEVIVRGEVNRQLPPPEGDPRSTTERMRDIRSWDQCVMRLQSASEDPTRPQLETPEEACARALGMSDRTAVPLSRSE